MKRYSEEEELLINDFKENGGKKLVFYKQGKLNLEPQEIKALSRLIRYGVVKRITSGDPKWVLYGLKY